MADVADEEPKSNQEPVKSTDKQSGSKGKLLKFILIPVILVVQAAAAYFIVFNFLAVDANEKPEEKKDEHHNRVGLFYEIKDLVINPAQSLGRRYLVAEIGLETTNEKVIAEASTKDIWIRDGILSALNRKTAEDLLNISQRDSLKKEILILVNDKMSTGKFEKVYFTKYIMQ